MYQVLPSAQRYSTATFLSFASSKRWEWNQAAEAVEVLLTASGQVRRCRSCPPASGVPPTAGILRHSSELRVCEPPSGDSVLAAL
jgi:hypothetical protein